MPSTIGTRITKLNSLVINFDGLDIFQNRNLIDKNILPVHNWKSGSVAPTFFSNNGSVSENNRDYYTDPWGNENLIWNSISAGNNNDDGGWNTANFNINSNQKYRFTTWVNRVVQGNSGRFYLGVNGYGSENGVFGLNDTSSNTNPYFWVSNTPPDAQLPTNTWSLVVGIVHPWTYSGSADSTNGIYRTNGSKFSTITSYRWRQFNTQSRHRSYLYYSSDVTSAQRWIYPRVDLMDGTEPSIDDLINNRNKKIIDVINPSNEFTMLNGAYYNQNTRGIIMDGDDDLVTYYSPPLINNMNCTIHLFLKTETLVSTEKIILGYPNGTNQRLYIGQYGTKWDFGVGNKSWNSGEVNTGDVTSQRTLITLTLDNGVATMYVNGVQTLTKVYSPYSLASNTFQLGSNFTKLYNFKGTIYSLQIFNEVFTRENIVNYYLRRKNRVIWQ